MSKVTAVRDDLLVVIEDEGRPSVYPEDRTPEVVGILTTPAKIKHAEYTATGISDQIRTLQPGEVGHARASLSAAGFDVVEL